MQSAAYFKQSSIIVSQAQRPGTKPPLWLKVLPDGKSVTQHPARGNKIGQWHVDTFLETIQIID